jgi:hypothetical protein
MNHWILTKIDCEPIAIRLLTESSQYLDEYTIDKHEKATILLIDFFSIESNAVRAAAAFTAGL